MTHYSSFVMVVEMNLYLQRQGGRELMELICWAKNYFQYYLTIAILQKEVQKSKWVVGTTKLCCFEKKKQDKRRDTISNCNYYLLLKNTYIEIKSN
mmetsp:Transcript_8925/g.9520  ORF Transcript_8925/g.9520 Transcript_8925/m.9520 type:complete len:96 (-) Transcript_8925:41-328(-)